MAPIQGTLDAKSLFNGEWFGCTPPLAAVLLAKLPFQRLVCHRVLDSCSGGVERATAVEHGGGFPPPSFATLYAVAATIINPSSFASQFVAKLKCLAVTMVVSTLDHPTHAVPVLLTHPRSWQLLLRECRLCSRDCSHPAPRCRFMACHCCPARVDGLRSPWWPRERLKRRAEQGSRRTRSPTHEGACVLARHSASMLTASSRGTTVVMMGCEQPALVGGGLEGDGHRQAAPRCVVAKHCNMF